MNFKKVFIPTFVALLVISGLLLDAHSAAAASKRIQRKAPTGATTMMSEWNPRAPQTKMPSFFAVGGLTKGQHAPLSFLKEVSNGTCESGCCWASGCNVSCSETRCFASCGEDDTAEYICSAQ